MAGPEVKVVDTAVQNFTMSTTSIGQVLNTISLGSDLFNRVGRQIQMISVHLRGYFISAGNAVVPDYLRVLLVYDRQPDGSTAVFNDVITSIDNAGGVTHASQDFPDQGNLDRFKILSDIHVPLIPAGGAAGAATPQPGVENPQNLEIFFDRYVKLGGLEARYGAGATVPQSGAVLLLAKGNVAFASAPYDLIVNARLTYTDN